MNSNPLSIAFKQRNKIVCVSCLLRPTYFQSLQQLRLYATAYPQPDPAVAKALYGDDNDSLVLNYDEKWKKHKPSAKGAAKATANATGFLSVNAKSRKKKYLSSLVESRRESEGDTTASELPPLGTTIKQGGTEFQGKQPEKEPDDKTPDDGKRNIKESKVSSLSASLTQLVKLMRNASTKKSNKDVKLHDLSRPAEKSKKHTKRQDLSESLGALRTMVKPQKKLKNTPTKLFEKGEKPGNDKVSKVKEKQEDDLRDIPAEVLKEYEELKSDAVLKPIFHEIGEKMKDHQSEKEKTYKERQKLKRANKIKQNKLKKLKKDGKKRKATSSEVDEQSPNMRKGEESSSPSKKMQMNNQTSQGSQNLTIQKLQPQTPLVLKMSTDVPEEKSRAIATLRHETRKGLAQKPETDVSDVTTTVKATVPTHRSTRTIVRKENSDHSTQTKTLHKKSPDNIHKTETLIQRLSHEITNLKDSLAVKFAALKLNKRVARVLEGPTEAVGATPRKVVLKSMSDQL